MRRIHCYTGPDGQTESGLTLTEVKKRLRKQGGSGYTQHFDRDGSFQENTPITLGNNARTTYQAEYNTSRKFNTTVDVTKAEEDLDVPAFINKVVEQAKAENLGEEDNARLMELLGPQLGEMAAYITDTWYDWALCQIHGRLYHEFRGMGRYGRRSDAIKEWKLNNKKPANHETDNKIQ